MKGSPLMDIDYTISKTKNGRQPVEEHRLYGVHDARKVNDYLWGHRKNRDTWPLAVEVDEHMVWLRWTSTNRKATLHHIVMIRVAPRSTDAACRKAVALAKRIVREWGAQSFTSAVDGDEWFTPAGAA